MITRGRAAEVGIKHSSLSELYTKPMDTTNSKRQYKKATRNVLFVLSTPTTTSNSKYSLLVLKVLLIIII